MAGTGWLRRIPRGSIQFHPGQIRAALGSLGPGNDEQRVGEFEAAFGEYQGSRHCIAVSSGKVALALILQGLGAREGDGIVMASYNVPEVISVVAGMGLRPRLADIDPGTLNIDPDSVARVADEGTRFLLVTHLYGHPAHLDRLQAVAERLGLEVIEDCAQGLGATWRGTRLGVFGRAALFSFGLMKNLNTVQGGMVATSDNGLAQRVRRIANDAGFERRLPVITGLARGLGFWAGTRRLPFSLGLYPWIRAVEGLAPSLVYRMTKLRPAEFETGSLDVGPLTARMNGIQAALGTAGLPLVDEASARRSHNARHLISRLEGVEPVRCQVSLEEGGQTWVNFVIRVPDRVAVKRRLLREGIDTTMGFLVACNRMPGMEDQADPCPVSEDLERTNLYLPIWPELDHEDLDRVADGVIRAVAPL